MRRKSTETPSSVRILINWAGDSGFSLAHIASFALITCYLVVVKSIVASQTLFHLGLGLFWAHISRWTLVASSGSTKRVSSCGAISWRSLAVFYVLTCRGNNTFLLPLVRLPHTSLVWAIDLVSVLQLFVWTGIVNWTDCASHSAFN